MSDRTTRLSTYNYELPASKIAQFPLEKRDESRLLVIDRQTQRISHQRFADLGALLQPGDVLVANNSRVLPARLFGRKRTGGKVELLLLEEEEDGRWRVLVGGKKVHAGTVVTLMDREQNETGVEVEILDNGDGGQRTVRFSESITNLLGRLGHTPLPPYIHQRLADGERYQTVYARPLGSAAAPTAGLHFTPDLLLQLRQQGVQFETITLHVGLDTFKPVETDEISEHPIHSEWMQLTPESARRINEAKLAGKRIVAIGTTSVRALESAAWRSAGEFGPLRHASQLSPPGYCPWKPVAAYEGRTDLFIYPGYHFRVVDAMITNFHLPQSTLMMLVSAFAGVDRIRESYLEAKEQGYRFLSFGDAMLIL